MLWTPKALMTIERVRHSPKQSPQSWEFERERFWWNRHKELWLTREK